MRKHKMVKLTRELLDEETQLNETFNPSMPKWLQDALNVVKMQNSGDWEKRKAKKADLKRRGVDTSHIEGGELIRKLLSLGNIDVNRARFISGDVPESSRDDRLKEPYIPIFLLEDEYGGRTVVAKGVNDEVKLPDSREQVKYSSMKKVLEKAKAFCYVDASDPRNQVEGRRNERDQLQKELRNIPNYYRYPSKAGYSSIFNGTYDKSGYLINPDKYKNALTKLRRNDIQSSLNKLYDRLNDVRAKALATIGDTDLRQLSNRGRGNDATRLIGMNAFGELSKACARYNELCELVEDALNNSKYSQEERDKKLDEIIISDADVKSPYRRVEDSINELVDTLKQAYSTKINWR